MLPVHQIILEGFFEGSRDTEDLINDAENSAAITGFKL